jgi:hypothetical protein
MNYARNEIRKRTRSHRGRQEQELVNEAQREIERFIADVLTGKRSQGKSKKNSKDQDRQKDK